MYNYICENLEKLLVENNNNTQTVYNYNADPIEMRGEFIGTRKSIVVAESRNVFRRHLRWHICYDYDNITPVIGYTYADRDSSYLHEARVLAPELARVAINYL